MTNEYQPEYKWRPTWPGETNREGKPLQDFTGFDGEQSFGRIQVDEVTTSKLGMWKWNATHVPWVRKRITPHGGWEATSREACRKVEEHYEKLMELHGRPITSR
ncbi:hypothetical protein HFO09_23105 [Rhizobium laguerreae]|uniref:hypothetical protein n=1 Tax=Rhizobium laguerreae TaxID=1076926 RepID=UPI001C90B462|nr:hypothetical protein [Rhizobium laguerreae]MBY3257045.1 hypothetical protein [Rhizobium laguerreae]MBY3282406.1 hypothetical protein [Rhizobium laguerreae]MBY3291933.1 hypothetical protein [Rhizobium laguerreae]